jgi:peptidoglycan/LPS O-acetylase OafA/YrhL
VLLALLIVLVTISQGAGLADTSVLPGRIPASLSLSIVLGAAAALVVSIPRGFALLACVLGRSWSAPATAVLLVIALVFITQQQVIQCLMVAVVVSVCLAEQTPLHPLLQWRPLAFIGMISYVYLLHKLSANVVRAVMHQTYGVLVFAATLGTVIAVAYLSFRYFETPLLKPKRRFETKDQRKGDELNSHHRQVNWPGPFYSGRLRGCARPSPRASLPAIRARLGRPASGEPVSSSAAAASSLVFCPAPSSS